MKYLIIIFFISTLSIFAIQDEDEQTWSLDSLDYNDLDFEADFYFKSSTGWFPTIVTSSTSYILYLESGGLHDEAKIRHSAFLAPSRRPLIDNYNLEPDQTEFRKKFSNDAGDPGPEANFTEVGLGMKLKMSNYNFLRLKLGYSWGKSILGSVDNSKRYLAANGNIKTLKEANLLLLSENGISFNLGFEIPVYGAFVRSEDSDLDSYYHLYMGLSGSHYLSSLVTQYLQIVDVKDEVRYRNGKDTLMLINEKQLENLILTKFRLDIGLGWRTTYEGTGYGYELTYSYPLTNVMTDQTWRQHIIKITVTIFLGSDLFK
jgi:filamentous hemagglutinin family protein